MRPVPWCSYPYSLITIIALLLPMQAYPAGLGEIAQRMAGSEFVFNRARSDIPFVPIAWLDVTVYDESRFMLPSGGPSDISFGQKTLSEATLVPFLLGSRDAFVAGQWISGTRFRLSGTGEHGRVQRCLADRLGATGVGRLAARGICRSARAHQRQRWCVLGVHGRRVRALAARRSPGVVVRLLWGCCSTRGVLALHGRSTSIGP